MPLKFPAVAVFYVNIWLNEKYQKYQQIKDQLIEIAEKNHCHGFADPKFLFIKRADLRTGDLAFTFEGYHNTSKFLNEILPLEYLVEVKLGRLKD